MIENVGTNAWRGEYRSRDRTIPPAFAPAYKTSVSRSPRKPLLALQESLSELTGPVSGHDILDPLDNDLILNGRVDRDPIGERIIVHGRVLDENARPVPGVLLEFWQCNSAGRYRHVRDQYVAPIDPNSSAAAAASPTMTTGTASAPSSPAPIPGATGSTTGARPTSTFRSSATASCSGWSRRCISRASRS